jgi:hypothetical protein
LFVARAYDYGRKVQNDDNEQYDDDDDELTMGITGQANYFTRGEGSRNFTFGGRPVEARAPTDDDDDDDDDDDNEGLFLLKIYFHDFE